jgi:hypothetical protein
MAFGRDYIFKPLLNVGECSQCSGPKYGGGRDLHGMNGLLATLVSATHREHGFGCAQTGVHFRVCLPGALGRVDSLQRERDGCWACNSV